MGLVLSIYRVSGGISGSQRSERQSDRRKGPTRTKKEVRIVCRGGLQDLDPDLRTENGARIVSSKRQSERGKGPTCTKKGGEYTVVCRESLGF